MFSINYLRNKKVLLAIVVVMAIAFTSYKFFHTPKLENIKKTEEKIKKVKTASVEELNRNKTPLQLIGEVVSKNEANIRSEIQGEVVAVYKTQGQYINAGSVIAEMENISQRAAVSQAKAAVNAAEANLSIFELQTDNTEKLLNNAKQATINTLKNTLVMVDDSIRNKADQLFSNPRSSTPKLNFIVGDSQLRIDIEWNRFLAGEMLSNWNDNLAQINISSDLFLALGEAEKNLADTKAFLDNVALAVNRLKIHSGLSQATIDAWKASILTARANINGLIVEVSTAKDNLNSKQSAYDISKKEGTRDVNNVSSEAIRGKALLAGARAGLRSAKANLEKTIIRSSINGTINKLNIEKGDFVGAFEKVATVSNNNALEIKSFITEEEQKNIFINTKVIINGKIEGIVTKIAPAVDKKTKKIEVTVGVISTESNLINGGIVSLSIERDFNVENFDKFIIPISALKIDILETVVFTVSEDGVLISHPVKVGSIVGKNIIINSGISPLMEVVLDGRGLREGQKVVKVK